jgi:ubiquinone/menaquinone biosynthesis C-methylase UbiE
MTGTRPSPERVLQLSTGIWTAAILAAATTHSVFAHLEAGEDTVEKLAKRADISQRGAQAVLDGLVGLRLVDLREGAYRNSADASTYLVAGRPGYLGDFATVLLTTAAHWSAFPEVVRTGVPVMSDTHDTSDSSFWEQLVPAIAPTSAPAAAIAAEVLNLAAASEVSVLDVGGGSGIYSAVWLGINPNAQVTQLDWPAVNAIARQRVANLGFADRFSCIDGDLRTTDFGHAAYDIAIYSHIAHQQGPTEIVTVLRRLRAAIKPGGTLVVSELVVDDDRSGPAFPLIFAAPMLLQSRAGSTWRRGDYYQWLSEAGFDDITERPTGTPSTLIFAKSPAQRPSVGVTGIEPVTARV